jgi:dTDP-4-amino-4,6-dideoxygalactose transaminase
LIDCLAAELIEARHVWKPMHLQPVFAGTRFFPHSGGSVSDALFRDGVCLPSGSNMTDGQVDRVVDEVRRALGH